MKIITIPHPTLREVAAEVKTVDKKLIQFIADLEATLAATVKPKGVGLAAPQVDRLKRIFTLNLGRNEKEDTLRSLINPVIVKHSPNQTFGPDEEDPYLEGCLSIPGIYGPVPRWQWVEVEFQVIGGGQSEARSETRSELQLVTHHEVFEDFAARVVQHEMDHLDGILFTDYSLEFDLPLYTENKKNKKMEEIDKSLLNLV